MFFLQKKLHDSLYSFKFLFKVPFLSNIAAFSYPVRLSKRQGLSPSHFQVGPRFLAPVERLGTPGHTQFRQARYKFKALVDSIKFDNLLERHTELRKVL